MSQQLCEVGTVTQVVNKGEELRTVIKRGTHLRLVGLFTLSTLQNYSSPIRGILYIPLSVIHRGTTFG